MLKPRSSPPRAVANRVRVERGLLGHKRLLNSADVIASVRQCDGAAGGAVLDNAPPEKTI